MSTSNSMERLLSPRKYFPPLTNEPVAVEVPAVRLTHRDWLDIQKVIASLGTLQRKVYGVDLEHAIISGAALADDAKLAADLMMRLEIQEEAE